MNSVNTPPPSVHAVVRRHNPARSQSGQASIVVLVFFLTAVSAIAALGTSDFTSNAGRTQLLTRQITSTLGELTQWFENTGMASLGGTTPTESDLRAVLSTRHPALRIGMSTPIVRSGCVSVMDCEPSRQILVWYPATSPQPSAALVNGLPLHETGGDALWRLYDSRATTQQRLASGYSQMLAASRAISSWANSQRQASIYAVEANFLRAGNCGLPGDALPCLTGWTPITSVSPAMTAAGLAALDVTSPWGSVIEISNAAPEASHVAPYTLAMRLRTPAGAYLTYSTTQ
jgi:hypothetical protein